MAIRDGEVPLPPGSHGCGTASPLFVKHLSLSPEPAVSIRLAVWWALEIHVTLPHTPGAGDLNPGPHVWVAITLPTEASLQPCAFFSGWWWWR